MRHIIETTYNWLRYFTAFVMVAGAFALILPMVLR